MNCIYSITSWNSSLASWFGHSIVVSREAAAFFKGCRYAFLTKRNRSLVISILGVGSSSPTLKMLPMNLASTEPAFESRDGLGGMYS